MVYVDTSALVPLFVEEPMSGPVHREARGSGESLVLSDWSFVEFSSAMALKVRTGQLTAAAAKRVTAQLHAFAEHCTIATPRRHDYERAAAMAADPSINLRAGDALHLAIAESLGGASLLCLDRAMCDAARGLGLKVVAF